MTTRPKSVLFIVGATNVYGAEIAMLNIMCGLKTRGHKVHCIASGWGDGDFISRLRRNNIPFTSLKLGFLYLKKPLWTLGTLWNLPSALVKFYKTEKEFGPDYVYHVTYRTIAMLYPLVRRKNTLYHVHEIAPCTRKNRLFFSIVKRKVALFIAASEAVRKSLLDVGISAHDVRVVLNGVSNCAQNAAAERRENARFTIGVVGRIAERKGHGILVEALRVLKQMKRDFECLIIGEGDREYVEELKTEISRKALEPKVKWLGYIADPSSIFAHIDVLAVPSLGEAFGLVALEAALRGIPVVASRVGGLPEIILDGVTGFLFEPGNSNELAKKILTLMDDADLRRRIGTTARQHARANFSEETMCDGIEKVLK